MGGCTSKNDITAKPNKKMIQAVDNPDQFINIPEDAQTVCKLIEKNVDNQFSLEISEKRQLSPDTLFLKLKFPNPEWTMGIPLT